MIWSLTVGRTGVELGDSHSFSTPHLQPGLSAVPRGYDGLSRRKAEPRRRLCGVHEDAPGDVVLGSHLAPQPEAGEPGGAGAGELEPPGRAAGGDVPSGGVALGCSCARGGLRWVQIPIDPSTTATLELWGGGDRLWDLPQPWWLCPTVFPVWDHTLGLLCFPPPGHQEIHESHPGRPQHGWAPGEVQKETFGALWPWGWSRGFGEGGICCVG